MQPAYIATAVKPGVRVTVKLKEGETCDVPLQQGGTAHSGEVVDALEPCQKRGLYWGYQTRLAGTVRDIFDGCPFEASPLAALQISIYTSSARPWVLECPLLWALGPRVSIIVRPGV